MDWCQNTLMGDRYDPEAWKIMFKAESIPGLNRLQRIEISVSFTVMPAPGGHPAFVPEHAGIQNK